VVATLAGYAGGTTATPTYRDMGDHTEALLVAFDPGVISYQELLDVFWERHTPLRAPRRPQYASIILYSTAEQKKLALASKQARESEVGGELHTRLAPAGAFHVAEDYHQKYFLRMAPGLLAQMQRLYPDPADLARSTAAARINGLLGGHADPALTAREIDDWGLNQAARDRLLEMAGPVPQCTS
jgi:peptide-methionine (S)-S-oxide reductase